MTIYKVQRESYCAMHGLVLGTLWLTGSVPALWSHQQLVVLAHRLAIVTELLGACSCVRLSQFQVLHLNNSKILILSHTLLSLKLGCTMRSGQRKSSHC